jgi:hypothetical protein
LTGFTYRGSRSPEADPAGTASGYQMPRWLQSRRRPPLCCALHRRAAVQQRRLHSHRHSRCRWLLAHLLQQRHQRQRQRQPLLCQRRQPLQRRQSCTPPPARHGQLASLQTRTVAATAAQRQLHRCMRMRKRCMRSLPQLGVHIIAAAPRRTQLGLLHAWQLSRRGHMRPGKQQRVLQRPEVLSRLTSRRACRQQARRCAPSGRHGPTCSRLTSTLSRAPSICCPRFRCIRKRCHPQV